MTRRHWRVLVVGVVLGSGLATWRPWRTRLQVLRKGGHGPPTLMLLHGFGSSAEHWLPYAQTIALSPPQGRFLFPQAPTLMKRADDPVPGRVWWLLDLAAHRRPGKLGCDLTDEDPSGVESAAELVRRTLSDEGNGKPHPFVVGGFSQGAMVACEIAFTSDVPLAGLVVLSGTPMDRAGWRAYMAARKNLPVFMSHGRRDDVLPFDLAVRLRADMVAAGIPVTFVSFDGGYEIPVEVVIALNKFLASLQH